MALSGNNYDLAGNLRWRISFEQQEQQEQQELVEKQAKEEQIALVKEATIAVETTEKDKNRANYEKVTELVGSLKPKNQDLADRLTAIDTYLTKE